MFKYTVLSAGLVLFSVLPALAAPKVSCDAIDQAISANEDFVEIALGDNAATRAEAQKAVRDNFALVSAALAPKLAAEAKAAMAKLDQAFAADDMSKAALAAMENYAVLVEAFEQHLPTTGAVAMLDHAGFKLQGLAAAKTIDWSAVGETVTASDALLETVKQQLTDKAVKDLLQTISTSLADAATAKNVAWLSASAQMLLDSVDLIERTVKNKSKQACK